MLVMLDQNLPSKFVSILNALCSRVFETKSSTVAFVLSFSSAFDVFSSKCIRPGDVQKVGLLPTFLAPPGLLQASGLCGGKRPGYQKENK